MPTLGVVLSRDKLKIQHEPHWQKLSAGCFLGFRKLTPSSTGTWLARYRDDQGKQQKRSLGEFGDIPPSQRYDAAKKAAEAWFLHLGKGGAAEAVTVRVACERYVKHVRANRGDTPADDLDMRFKRWVFCDRGLADLDLAKLTKTRVESWRYAMTQTPVKVNRDNREVPITRSRAASSVNRDMAALRAAFNFAHDAGSVTTDMAWRVALRPAKNADGRRDVYLDRDQRRALIENASTDLAALLQALALVPLRPGAVAALTVGSFDARRSVLTIGKDKAGRDRRIKLPELTAALFEQHAKDRELTAPLLCRQDGQAWNKDAWKGPVKAAAASAELPPATTAYALRHSVITDLVTDGLDLLTVAQLSGTSVAMIERHYGHLRADHAAAALARLTL
ncbi:tyrosine-type recombinase/integrase [Ideonella sp. A 288]|uniref:tyrosine-type recombinase/integrase n=1 Tax=Ideonella sp. A 288 TaxID=1962181 RepID=UPI000B4B2918|nr:tyrosine-type recombinase/integrase [Ideonella sp. A 288]